MLDRDEFIAMRKTFGLTQTEWGSSLGLSLRAVQEIENGSTKLRELHVLAAERAALKIAAARGEPATGLASVPQCDA